MLQFLLPIVGKLKNAILDTLFPVRCLCCGQEEGVLCSKCVGQWQTLTEQVCAACREASPDGWTHEACKQNSPIDRLLSLYDYKDAEVSATIISGKYQFIPDVFKVLGERLGVFLVSAAALEVDNNAHRSSIICPIPLAKSRRRWRGFNQAEIIAEAVGRQSGWAIQECLQRVKSTKVQKDLSREERLKNVADCFAVGSRPTAGKTLILVDDVITTGATLAQAAAVVKESGAAQVWAATIARD